MDVVEPEKFSPPITNGKVGEGSLDDHAYQLKDDSENVFDPMSFEVCQPDFTPYYDTPSNKEHLESGSASKAALTSDSSTLSAANEEEPTFENRPIGRPTKCPLCEKIYSVKEYLRLHIRLAHRKEYVDWTSQFGEGKKASSGITNTVVIEGDQGDILAYTYCMSGSDNEDGHIKITDITVYPEAECTVSSKAETTVGKNRKKESPSYICFKCNKVFTNRIIIQRHLSEQHSEPKKYPCQMCNAEYLLLSSLRRHKRIKHKALASFECNVCGRRFHSSEGVQAHKLRMHGAKTKHLVCKTCNRAFSLLASYCHHRKMCHSDPTPLSCDICFKKFSSVSDLASHQRERHHAEARKRRKAIRDIPQEYAKYMYKCRNCKRGFAVRSAWIRHKKICSKVRCKKYCSELLKPSRKPMETRDLVKGVESDLLNSDDDSPYNKTSGDSVAKARSFCCTTCNRVYSSNFSLKRHMTSKHKKKGSNHSYCCTICGVEYAYRYSLTRHNRNKHKT